MWPWWDGEVRISEEEVEVDGSSDQLKSELIPVSLNEFSAKLAKCRRFCKD